MGSTAPAAGLLTAPSVRLLAKALTAPVRTEWDELKLREWTDVNTAILYAPCHGRSSDLPAAFLSTLRFDDVGNWKIIKAHQMSEKEVER